MRPKCFPHPQATELAAGSDDILQAAVVVEELHEALVGCQLVLMTSARARSLALKGLTPVEAAELVMLTHPTQSVALVFGRERTGLTNAELLLGHYHIVIPANPSYSSLNVSQAVQIIVYELRMCALKPAAMVNMRLEDLAEHDAVELFYQHLAEGVGANWFLRPTAPRRLMQRVRRLFGRIQLERMEAGICYEGC